MTITTHPLSQTICTRTQTMLHTHCMTICKRTHTLHRHILYTLFLTICNTTYTHTHTHRPCAREHTTTLSDTVYMTTQTIYVRLQTNNSVYLPEVSHGGGQRALSGDVRGVTRVMIHLRERKHTINLSASHAVWLYVV